MRVTNSFRHALATVAVFSGLLLGAASGNTITQWSFSTAVAAPDNSPAPTTGLGTATALGMTLDGSATTNCDVTSTSGTAVSTFSEYMWRVRGSTNGWTTAAPEYAQGIELDTSTAGYQNIQFSFDWYCTAQGIRDLQFQYNTNVSNPAGWTNFGGTSPNTYLAAAKDFYNPSTPPGTISVNLSSISGAGNDPNFGIRLVSAYDSTGYLGNTYASPTLSGGHTVVYNNSSGNWRFDNMTFSGTPVPEPSALSLVLALSIVGVAVLAWRRHD